ncbi:MAG: hypothetical protein ACTSQQ_14440 [Candidatus Helarchaeota archaeon]
MVGITIGFLFILLIILIYFKFFRGREIRRVSAAQIKNQIGDLSNLSHILIIYKDRGTAIFSQTFGYEHLESHLLSGLLEAMNIVGSKVGAKGKLRRLEYEKYRILIHEGRWIRGVVMCREKPSSFLEDALTVFVKKFENKFAGRLMEWSGEINKFETAVELVDECFSTALIYPMVVLWEGQNPEELTELERKIIDVAKEVCLENECFIIPDLLEILKERLKKSPDRLLAVLYDLHKRQYLISLT